MSEREQKPPHLASERGGRQLAAKTHPIIHLASFVIPYPRFGKIFGYNIGCIADITKFYPIIDPLNSLGTSVILRGSKSGIETGGDQV
jgi:hypothetical protein